MFISRINYKKEKPEENDGISEVEDAGHMTASQRIEQMIESGRRLTISRQNYDFAAGEKVDHDFHDPTRLGIFDLSDATELVREAEANLREARRIKLEQERIDKEKEVTNGQKDLETKSSEEKGS